MANDLLAATGLGLLAYGLHQVYPPAAFIAVGLVLMGIGVLGALGNAAAARKP